MSRVTDEMVERALHVFRLWDDATMPVNVAGMRAALEAALAEPTPEPEPDPERERWIEVLSSGLRGYYVRQGVETSGSEFRALCDGFLDLLFTEWEERPPAALVTQSTEGRVKAGFRALASRHRGAK